MPSQPQPFFKRVFGLRLFFLANLIALVLVGLSFGREYVRSRDIEQDIARLQAQAAELEAERIRITDLNTALQTESAIEREARLKLGLKKPGEEVVVIQEGPGESDGPTGSEDQEVSVELAAARTGDPADGSAEQVANPGKWWYYFFDHQRFEQIARYGNF